VAPGEIARVPDAGAVRRLKALSRSATTGSLAAAVVGQLALVLSGVLTARLLGVEDRGHLALLILFPVVLTQVGSLGLPLALTYEIARHPRRARALVRTLAVPMLLQMLVLLAALGALVLLVFGDRSDSVRHASAMTLAAVPILLLQQYWLAVLQGQQRFRALNSLRQLPALLFAASVVLAAVTGTDELEAIVGLWILSYGVATAVIVARVLWRRDAEDELDGAQPADRRRMARFGLRGLLGAVAPMEVFRVDQLIVGLVLSPVALGLYVVALAFTTFPRLISHSIGVVAYPRIAAEPDRGVARRHAWRYFWLCGALTAAFVACLEVAAPWLIRFFFGADFAGAADTTRILLLSALLLSLRRILIDSAQGVGLPGIGTISELVMLVVLVPALVVLTPAWGIEGVATAVTIASGVSLGVALLLFASGGVQAAVTLVWRLPGRARELGLGAVAACGAVAVSLVAGAAAAFLPPLLVVALITGGGLVLLVAVGRRTLARRPQAVGVSSARESLPVSDDGRDERDADGLRLPRLAYYLGLLFMGQLTLRPALNFTLSDWLFLVSLLLTLAILGMTHRRLGAAIPRLLLVGAGFIALGGLTASYVAEDWLGSLAVTLRLLYLTVAWFWLAVVLLRTIRQVATAVAMWVASAAVSGAAAGVQLIFGDVVPGGRIDAGRLTGFTDHVNDLGGLTAVALVPALALAVYGGRRGLFGLVRYSLLLFVAAGLVLSGSVGGLIAATAGVFVWLAAARPARRIWVVALVGVAAIVVLARLQGSAGAPTPVERVLTVADQDRLEAATLWTRLDSYRLAWDAIQDQPLVGVGLDQESTVIPELGVPVHNLFLGFWLSAGILGAVGILLVLVELARIAVRNVRAAQEPVAAVLAPALLASFGAFVVYGLGAPIDYKRYGWVAAALLLAFAACSARKAPAPRGAELPRAAGLRPATAGRAD
jgi:O-antigen/teichoic acid export membrane protein/O-antigen ligase